MKNLKKILTLTLIALINLSTFSQTKKAPQETEHYDTSGGPVKFEFKYRKGDSYRILSTVNEYVYVNRKLHRKAEIINRISTTITDVDSEQNATHNCIFMTTEKDVAAGENPDTNIQQNFSWGKEYTSIFIRSKQGKYTIEDQYFMPTVRDVPLFPDREVKPGETWTAEGHEAHDLTESFGLLTPYKVPFTATYTYLGTVGKYKTEVRQMSYFQSSMSKQANNEVLSKTGSKLHVFSVKYNFYTDTPERIGKYNDPYTDYPKTMMGFSEELVYWDAEKGAIDHYSETFRIVMETGYGYTFEFRGSAHAEVQNFRRTSTPENVKSVQSIINELGLDNVTVKQGEKGLTLSIENIQFKAESSVLMESEKLKLQKLRKILDAYPENDILVSGHTAYADNGKDPQVLSEQRAQTVADYLVQLGMKDRYHIFTQGFGDTKPIAPNTTESGKAKNRRVEITIMDK